MGSNGSDLVASIETACKIWFNPLQERTVRELDQLPVSEREKVWADFSGDTKLSAFTSGVEDPNDMDGHLMKLHDEIAKVSDKKAFEQAQKASPEYTDSREFRLGFLRTDQFDAQAAAQRITQHFEQKKQLFGEESIGREILLSDLSPCEQEILQSGLFQPLAEPDKGGRQILFFWYKALGSWTSDEVCRVQWYVLSVMSKQKEVQKLGLIRLAYLKDSEPKYIDYQVQLRATKAWNALPLRQSAVYYIANPTSWDHFIDVAVTMTSPSVRLRTRAVSGSNQECTYKLMCLGVPVIALPIDVIFSGRWKPDMHYKWIAYRRCLEAPNRRLIS